MRSTFVAIVVATNTSCTVDPGGGNPPLAPMECHDEIERVTARAEWTPSGTVRLTVAGIEAASMTIDSASPTPISRQNDTLIFELQPLAGGGYLNATIGVRCAAGPGKLQLSMTAGPPHLAKAGEPVTVELRAM